METPRIYDGRRVLDLEALKQAGWECYAVGRPTNAETGPLAVSIDQELYHNPMTEARSQPLAR